MEWRDEHPPPIPAERANLGLGQIGVVAYDDGLVRDALIVQCAAGLVASGYRLGGVVQSNAHRHGRRRCDMYVKDLRGGDEIEISLDRGEEARGCRLDPDAFARIDTWIERAVIERVDLLIINKFGREEAHGRGLRAVIARGSRCQNSPGDRCLHAESLRISDIRRGFSHTSKARHRGSHGLVPERD